MFNGEESCDTTTYIVLRLWKLLRNSPHISRIMAYIGRISVSAIVFIYRGPNITSKYKQKL